MRRLKRRQNGLFVSHVFNGWISLTSRNARENKCSPRHTYSVEAWIIISQALVSKIEKQHSVDASTEHKALTAQNIIISVAVIHT